MENFSLLVQKKYNELNPMQKRIFDEEYNRRKKTFVDNDNSDLALEILRDILLMLPDNNTAKEDSRPIRSVNDHYKAQKNKSRGSYSFFIIVGFLILFCVSGFYLKPNRTQMQNKIVDEMLKNQPELLKLMKDFFVGELTSQKSENFVLNYISSNGYKNLEVNESDFVIVRRLIFKSSDSNEDLITSYGLFGFTKVIFNEKKLEEFSFFNNRRPNSYQVEGNNSYNDYQRINTSNDYENTNSRNFEKPKTKVEEDNKQRNTVEGGNSYYENRKQDIQEDSIKI